ncbi:hypothetical protein I4U23_016450 [Adineta vaga]|nr:hypothetical protein I4U23_016450 [Adineta vaga]
MNISIRLIILFSFLIKLSFHYPLKNKIPNINININTSIWMKQILPSISNVYLTNLTLPGTHDAASYCEKLGIPLQDITTPWALF